MKTPRAGIQNTPGKVLVLSQHWSARIFSQNSPKFEGESVIPAGIGFSQGHPRSHRRKRPCGDFNFKGF